MDIKLYSASQLPEEVRNALQLVIQYLYIENAEKLTVPANGGILSIELEKTGAE